MLKNLSTNLIVFGGLNAVKSFIPILMLPILTAQLTTDEFGTLALIDSIILFLVPLVMVGISSSVSVFYHKLDSESYSIYVSNALFIAFISFFCFSVISLFFKNQLNDLFGLQGYIICFLAFFAILRGYSATVLAILQTSQALKIYSLLVVLQSLLDIMISYVAVVIFFQGMNGRLFGIYIAYALLSLVGISYLRKNGYLGGFNMKFSSDIVSFGIPLIPHAICGTIMAMADRLFISHYLGNEHIAGYVVAYQMAAIMLLFGTSINQAWTPIYFGMMRRNQTNKIKMAKVLLTIAICFSGCIIYFLMDFLFSSFVAEKLWFAKEYFPLMLLGFIFQSLYFVFVNYFFYTKQTKYIATLTAIGASINLFLNYILIQSHGVMGVAYANSITWGGVLIMVMMLSITFNRLKYHE